MRVGLQEWGGLRICDFPPPVSSVSPRRETVDHVQQKLLCGKFQILFANHKRSFLESLLKILRNTGGVGVSSFRRYGETVFRLLLIEKNYVSK
jgi:hypothetical protein